MDAASSRHEVPEGGWGWIVVIGSFWINGTICGLFNSFGLLYTKILEDVEDADGFKTSWIGAVHIGLTFFLSPFSSILTDKLGCRKTAMLGGLIAFVGILLSSFVKSLELLYLTYGLMLGSGCSICYTPSLVILGHYFKKRLGLINGLVTAGSGVFTIVQPILLKHLLDTIGLEHSLQFLSGIVFFMFISGSVFSQRMELPTDKYSLAESSADSDNSETTIQKKKHRPCCCCSVNIKQYLNVKIWKSPSYRILCVSIPIACIGYFIPFVHLVEHMKQTMPGKNSEIIIACLGATSLLGRLVFGKVADFPQINRFYLMQISLLGIGVVTTLIPIFVDYYILLAAILVMGVFDGCFVMLLGPLVFDVVGAENASQALGFLLGFMSIPMTAGPPLAGWLYDELGNYTVAFLVAGLPPIIGACIMFLVPPILHTVHLTTNEPLECRHMSREDLLDIDLDINVKASNNKLNGYHRHNGHLPNGVNTTEVNTIDAYNYYDGYEDYKSIDFKKLLLIDQVTVL